MVMEEHLDMDKLESYFGGKNTSGTNDSVDEASIDGEVFSSLEEDDDSTHGKMPCVQHESNMIDESKKTRRAESEEN
ncbi:hypothetical protein GmHk_04G010559 [Glycine max]|nr:hypothetical protein GmHk_04G010559 [Glycine max]